MTFQGISVLIPAYEMGFVGPSMIQRAIQSVRAQVGIRGGVEVVVADHSRDDSVLRAVETLESDAQFKLKYIRNDRKRGSASANLNTAFEESTGPIVKILFQDDFLTRDDSLALMQEIFDNPQVSWVACGATHTQDGFTFENDMVPYFHPRIHLGRNTISSPSVISLRRDAWVGFDQNLVWLMDVDFYKSMALTHGPPTIVPEILVANGLGGHQVTHTLISERRKLIELAYVYLKHLR